MLSTVALVVPDCVIEEFLLQRFGANHLVNMQFVRDICKLQLDFDRECLNIYLQRKEEALGSAC